MNEEDKKRFARYKKGYIPKSEDDDFIINLDKQTKQEKHSKDIIKQTTVLGYINNIDIQTDTMIKNITNKNITNKNITNKNEE